MNVPYYNAFDKKYCTIIWIFSAVPVIFCKLIIKTLLEGYNLGLHLLAYFNILEYTFIQHTFAGLISSGRTLCYEEDGQNGIQFVATGWLALPFLIGFSLLFDKLRDRKRQELYGE